VPGRAGTVCVYVDVDVVAVVVNVAIVVVVDGVVGVVVLTLLNNNFHILVTIISLSLYIRLFPEK